MNQDNHKDQSHEFDIEKEYDQLEDIIHIDVGSKTNFKGDERYSIIGTTQEQWSFVYTIREISKKRFGEVNFEPALVAGDVFCIYNEISTGSVIMFKEKRITLTSQDIGFILCYRTSLAKSMLVVSDVMYGCAKKVLSEDCFNNFFLMIDWKKINFYTLFDIERS